MEKLLEKYDVICASILVGKEPAKEDYNELRKIAAEVNKLSRTLKIDISGSDYDLIESIKQYIRAALE